MIANHRAMGGTHLGIREGKTVAVAVAMTNTTSLLQAEATSLLSLITAGLMVVLGVAISITKKRLNINHRRGMLQEDKSTITITATRNHHLSKRGSSEITNNITTGTPTTITTRAGTTTSRRTTTSPRASPPTAMRTRSTPR